jgi:WD40-like Beta Propeller Repeat
MKKNTIITILLFIFQYSKAQEQLSLDKQAAVAYAKYDYAKAASMYERLAAKRKDKVQTQILERLANSYRYINEYAAAATWYAKLLSRTDAPPEARLYYGDMLKSLGRYAEARANYTQYSQKDQIVNRIAGCDAAQQWLQQPSTVFVRNEARLNTTGADWGATYYIRGIAFVSDSLYSQLLENSQHLKKMYGRTQRNYQKMYRSDSSTYGTVYIKDFSPSFNWSHYHVGPVAFDPAFHSAYVTLTNPRQRIPAAKTDKVKYGYRRLELFFSEQDSSGNWKKLSPFPYNKPEAYSLGHAALSVDGRTIYFASDMPGGQGKTDIWYSEKQAGGKWGQPVNCGPSVNTTEEEEFPTIAPDGSLYFSSKGWIGMGGFDIFHTTGSNAQWSHPENLRSPVNSPGDDFYYVANADGGAYFSSNRSGGKGNDDIYSLAGPGKPAFTKIPTAATIPFTGIICTKLNDACIYIFNKQRGIGWCFIGQPDREISLTLEKETDYVIRITYPGGHKKDSILFNTRGLNNMEVLRKEICK